MLPVEHCHACSMSKGVILQNSIPYMITMQKYNEQADSASGMQRSKVTEAESSMIEKEAVELNIRTLSLHCTLQAGMAIRPKSELACKVIHVTIESSASVGCTCTWAETNLDNYVCVIYDVHVVTKRTPGHKFCQMA